ncbi:hypothetical protein LEMLEM_LOCUS16761, partial [Lemmus lemmus]
MDTLPFRWRAALKLLARSADLSPQSGTSSQHHTQPGLLPWKPRRCSLALALRS